MSVDVGGLDYTLKVKDEFSDTLTKFNTGISDAKKRMESLRSASRERRTSPSTEEARQAREQIKTERELGRIQSGRHERNRRAIKTYNDQYRQQLHNEKVAQVAKDKSWRNERKALTTTEQRRKAEKDVTRVLENRDRLQARSQAVAAKGVRLTEEETRKLGLASKLRLKISEASKRREAAERRVKKVLGDQEQIMRTMQALQAKGIKLSQLTSKQATQLGLASPISLPKQRGPVPPQPSPQEGTQSILQKVKAWLRLDKAQAKAGKTANRISFTFRRLFGILAAFAAVRMAIGGIVGLVKEMVTLNAFIEQAHLGLASLYMATGQVRDATGETVDKAQQLVIAHAEAVKQTALLRKDALKTAATFKQLATAFQTATGPGLAAGMNLDQIREFTIRISQAASALGVKQNELSEEIRSLLSGTIQARTTRIATVLGITNEDIRNAKEAGNLVEYLREQFAAFAVAGEESLNTFNAIWTNLKDGIMLTLQSGGMEYFTEVKEMLKDIYSMVVSEDPISGALAPTPEASALIQAFASGLRTAAAEARRFVKSLNFSNILVSVRAFGAAIGAVPRLLFGLVRGFTNGFGSIVKIITKVVKALGEMTGISFKDSGLTEIAEVLGVILGMAVAIKLALFALTAVTVAWKVVTVALHGAWLLVKGALIAIQGVLIACQGAMVVLNVLSAILQAPLWVVYAIIAAVIALLTTGTILLKGWVEEVVGFKMSWSEFARFVKNSWGVLWEYVKAKVMQGLVNIKIMMQQIWQGIKYVIISGMELLIWPFKKLLQLAGKFSKSAKKIADNIDKNVKRLKEGNTKKTLQLENEREEYNKTVANLTESLKHELWQEGQKTKGDRPNDGKDYDTSLWGDLKRGADKLAASAGELFGDMAKKMQSNISAALQDGTKDGLLGSMDELLKAGQETQENSTDLVSAFKELPGTISAARKPLSKNSDLIKKMKKDLIEAKEELDKISMTRGLSGWMADQIEEEIESVTGLKKTYDKLDTEESSGIRRRMKEMQTLAGIQSKIRNLTEDERKTVQEIQDCYVSRKEHEKILLVSQERLVIAQEKYRASKESEREGMADQIRLLKEKVDLATQDLQIHDEVSQEILQGIKNGEQLKDLALDEIKQKGILKVIEEDLTFIAQDRLDLEKKRIDILSTRLAALAMEELEATREELRISTLDLANRQKIASLRNSSAARYQSEIILSEMRMIREEAQIEADARMKSLMALDEQISMLREQGASEEHISTLIEQRNAKALEHVTLLQLANEELKEMSRELAIMNDPFGSGMRVTLETWKSELPSIGESFSQAIQDGLTGVSAILSSAIVQAFDPESNESISERFGRLLQGIAATILDAVISNLIAQMLTPLISMLPTVTATMTVAGTALSGAGAVLESAGLLLSSSGPTWMATGLKMAVASNTLATAGPLWVGIAAKLNAAALLLAGTSFLGMYQGGMVPAFSKAKGFAAGGSPSGNVFPLRRPGNLHPEDRIPIWAAAGEFIIRKSSVAKYGTAAITAINRGLVDPLSLQALAGVSETVARPVRTMRRLGFAEGGEIAGTPSTAHSNSTMSSDTPNVTVAIVPPSEENMARLLKGGKNSMLDFIDANKVIIQEMLER